MEDEWETNESGGKSFADLNMKDDGDDWTDSGWKDNSTTTAAAAENGWDDGWNDENTQSSAGDHHYSNDRKDRDNGGGGRGRFGIGGRGGRGGGRGSGRWNENDGGRGGFRNRDNNYDDSAQSGWNRDNDDKGIGGRGGRGGGRGSGRWNENDGGRGGFRNRDNNYDDSAQSGWNRDNDDKENNYFGGRSGERGSRGGRGGRGERGGRSENDGQGERRGGGGGGRRNRNDDDGDDNNNGESKPKKEFYIPPEPTNDENEIFGSGISSGINFDKYDKIPINISGKDVPSAINSFEESGLREFLLTNIQKSGYTRPTPVQKNSIPIIMSGRDLMGCAQTGSGKTAAFLLPIINELLNNNKNMTIGKPHVLIVLPTRELAIQIFNEARKFSLGSYLKIGLVYGGPAVKHQSDNVAKGCHILVATPGRLLHFMNLGFITFEDIRYVVLDEADRMIDMKFIPDIEKVMEHPTMPPMGEKQTLMFSATFPDDIQRLAGKFLHNYIFLAIGKVGGACTDVEQKFFQVAKYEKRTKLMELLEQGHDGTIVFVETKRNADFLASLLSETRFPTTSIHGDRFQRERELALAEFKSGKMAVLIATSLAARGLDMKNVEHVINYDLPKKIDEYVHRIGRTGRVGNYGRATSFFDPEQDADIAPELVKVLEEAGQEVPDFLINVSSGAGGYRRRGGRGGGGSRFGGHDVRNDDEFGTIGSEPEPQEPVEIW